MRKCISWALMAIVLIGIGASGAAADGNDDHGRLTVIAAGGATPFVYQGHTYVPLKRTADYLGAGLLWDAMHNRATLTYRDRELGLAIGSTSAYYMGQPVMLPVPPIVVNGQMLVPVILFDRYFEVPVRWQPEYNRVLILGPPGWGYYQALPYAPPYVVTIIRGYGPPPWAHGPGRPTGYAYYPGIYAPAPFVYYGTTYIPLRDASDVIGAALLWDSLRNRAVITYNGREFALIVGSPYAYYGGQMIALPAPPVVVGGYVYVPRDFFDRHLKVPVERDGGVLKLKGKTGWHEFNVAAAPPGYVYGAPERERERDREQARPGVGLPTQRGPEPARSQGSWMQQRDAENRSPAAKSSPAKRSGAKQSAGKSKQPQSKQGGKQGKQGGGWFKAKDQADKDD